MKEALMTRPEKVRQPIILPLAEVPLPEGRKHISSSLVHVAGHELNHAFVADALGVPVIQISVVPEGNSLGRTIVGGNASATSVQIIAAAGSVTTHDGTARGYGSDLFKVHVLASYGGMSVNDAVSHASSIVSSRHSHEVREKASEILAYLGEVPGSWLPLILERARLEVELEQESYDGALLFDPFTPEPADDKQLDEGDYTVIDDLGKVGSRIRYIVDGKIKKEELMCKICAGINGHFEGCPALKNKVEETSSFPQTGTIFERKKLVEAEELLK